MSTIDLGKGVESIGNSAFNATILTSLHIPASVTTLGSGSTADIFGSTKTITEITVDENNQYFSSDNGVLYNKEKTILIKYPTAKTDTSYVLEEGVTEIAYRAFYSSANITSLTIPSSLTKIGNQAFYNNTSLTNVHYHGTTSDYATLKTNIGSNNTVFTGTTFSYCENKAATVTCTVDGLSAGLYCPACEKYLTGGEPVTAKGHVEEAVLGYAATYNKTGLTDGIICSACDEIILEQQVIPVKELNENFKIKSAYLNLTQDINLVYRTSVPSEYTNFYMVFTFRGYDYKVNEYFTDADGNYCFKFENITPQYMGETIVARLYATVEEEEAYKENSGYSVKQYCIDLLNVLEDNETNKATRTLLSDLLVYGVMAQEYTTYDEENLVTNGLTLQNSEYTELTEESNKFALSGETSDIVSWNSAGLYLENSMALRIGFKVSEEVDLTKLKLEVSINGRTTIYNVSELTKDSDDIYRIYYRGVQATEFDDAIIAKFIYEEAEIGKTLQYSINSYIYQKQSDPDEKLVNIIKAIYNYGKSAKQYAEQ